MLFNDVTGQFHVKELLINSVKQQRISHAQLLLGPLGNGGLALALAYAQYVNCTNKGDEDSCGACPSCIKIQKLIHPDLHFSYPFPSIDGKKKSIDLIKEWREALLDNPYLSIKDWMIKFDAENKQANIPIDECHDIIRRLNMKVFEADYKIMIIWLPEYLGKEGNALLKILEEPPENTLFILVAEQHDKVLNTILSRTQTIKIPAIEFDELAKLVTSQFDLPEQDAFKLATLANGNQSLAISLAQHAANENTQLFIDWVELILAGPKRFGELNMWIEAFAKIGREAQKSFFDYALYLIEEMMRMQVVGQQSAVLSAKEVQLAHKLMPLTNDYYSLQQLSHKFSESQYHIERNASAKILMLNLSIQLGHLFRQKKLILTHS